MVRIQTIGNRVIFQLIKRRFNMFEVLVFSNLSRFITDVGNQRNLRRFRSLSVFFRVLIELIYIFGDKLSQKENKCKQRNVCENEGSAIKLN